MNKTLLISATARSGKDLLTKNFIKFFAENGIFAKRYAFADELKRKLDPLFLLNHGISAFTEDVKEKPLIRGMLLAYGKMCRDIDPYFWVKIIRAKIKENEKSHIAIISDHRYPNESLMFEDKVTINITRLNTDGESPPVGEDEKINMPILKQMADYKFYWTDCGDDLNKCEVLARELFNEIFSPRIKDFQEKFPII